MVMIDESMSIFDGSIMDPIEEAHFVLSELCQDENFPCDSFQMNNDLIIFAEDCEVSSCDLSLYDYTSFSESSCTTSVTDTKSSETSYGTAYSDFSYLSLEDETFALAFDNLISHIEIEWNIEDFYTDDEPLFWPFDYKLYWYLDLQMDGPFLPTIEFHGNCETSRGHCAPQKDILLPSIEKHRTPSGISSIPSCDFQNTSSLISSLEKFAEFWEIIASSLASGIEASIESLVGLNEFDGKEGLHTTDFDGD